MSTYTKYTTYNPTAGGFDYVSRITSLTSALDADFTLESNRIDTLVTKTSGINALGNTFTGDLVGNASTATTLQNSQLINGSNFNGSAPINIKTYIGAINPSADTSMYPVLVGANTVTNQVANTDASFVYNSTTKALTATTFIGNLTGNVTGNLTGNADGLAGLTSTIAELNIMDGGTADSSITLVDSDQIIINDNGTMAQTALSDLKSYINNFRGALVTQSGSQAMVSSQYRTIAFDTETYDTDNIHDNVTNNHRLVVPTGATRVRLIWNQVWYDQGVSVTLHALIKKNDDSYSNTAAIAGGTYTNSDTGSSNTNAFQLVSPVVEVVAGDWFCCAGYTSFTGSPSWMWSTNGVTSFFSLEVIE